MAARPGVEVNAIEAARRSVIELTLAHQTTARVARKQAVKDLFGTLLASWEAGVSFDSMAKALNTSGIDITTETLRGYFFELKTSEQLRAENEVHERAMAQLRQVNEARQRALDLQHARELARVGSEMANHTHAANVEAAHLVATGVVQTARRSSSTVTSPAPLATRKNLAPVAGAAHALRGQSRKPARADFSGAGASGVAGGEPAASASMPVPAGADSGQSVDRSVQQPPLGNEVATGAATSMPPTGNDGLRPGQARTLDEIARVSQGQQESTFPENLVLKEGNTVWCESGKPFDGFLSPRTLHTLRTVGKVIAPTVGRTAKDFVQMSHQL